MATTETDLLERDPVLLSLIDTFSKTLPPPVERPTRKRDRGWSHPFSLAGFPRFQLRERFHIDGLSDLLIWIARVRESRYWDSRFVELRYAMTASELGYVASEEARCRRRLRNLAEAHLRADLHMLECGLSSSSTRQITLLDERGRVRGSGA